MQFRCATMCQNVLDCARTCHVTRTMCQKCARMCQARVGTRTKCTSDVPECARMCQILAAMCQNVPDCARRADDCANMCHSCAGHVPGMLQPPGGSAPGVCETSSMSHAGRLTETTAREAGRQQPPKAGRLQRSPRSDGSPRWQADCDRRKIAREPRTRWAGFRRPCCVHLAEISERQGDLGGDLVGCRVSTSAVVRPGEVAGPELATRSAAAARARTCREISGAGCQSVVGPGRGATPCGANCSCHELSSVLRDLERSARSRRAG